MDVLAYAMAKAYTDKSMTEAADMIGRALNEVALPAVTTEDNDKMLQVVDGAWSAVKITDGNKEAY